MVAAGRRVVWWVALYVAALGLPVVVAPAAAGMSGWPIHSTVTRLMTVFGAGVLLCHVGIPRPAARGVRFGRALRTTLRVMTITVACTALYSTLLVAFDAESLRPAAEIFKPVRLLTALAGGLAVSALEEPIFRRFLFTRLSIRGKPAVGAVLSSMLYSTVHYLRPAKVAVQDHYSFADSLAVYRDILGNFLKPVTDPAPGVGLFLLGLFLCSMVRRGGLPWTVGIHAGVVYYAKVDTCLLYWNPVGRHPWFGSFDLLYDGALFWIVTGSAFLLALVWPRRPAAETGAE